MLKLHLNFITLTRTSSKIDTRYSTCFCCCQQILQFFPYDLFSQQNISCRTYFVINLNSLFGGTFSIESTKVCHFANLLRSKEFHAVFSVKYTQKSFTRCRCSSSCLRCVLELVVATLSTSCVFYGHIL